jgi:hypothetical protein
MPIEMEKQIETKMREAEIASPLVKVVYLLEKFEKVGRDLAELIPKDYKALTHGQKQQITARIHKIFPKLKTATKRPIKD